MKKKLIIDSAVLRCHGYSHPQFMTVQNSFKVMSRQKTGSYLFIYF